MRPIQAARDFLEQSAGDWNAAAEMFQKEIERDVALREELLEPLVADAIWYWIRRAANAARSKGPMTEPGPAGVALGEPPKLRLLYDYPMPCAGGRTLGDSTKAEVIEASEFHGMLATTNGARAKWFTVIAAKLSGDRCKVRTNLSEKVLQKLREECGA